MCFDNAVKFELSSPACRDSFSIFLMSPGQGSIRPLKSPEGYL